LVLEVRRMTCAVVDADVVEEAIEVIGAVLLRGDADIGGRKWYVARKTGPARYLRTVYI
jgi:hypothetical protein